MTAAELGVGFHPGIPDDAYHAGPGISKTGLWTIYKQSPAHYRFPPPPTEETAASRGVKDLGKAIHVAILEPERFEKAVMRGPADRRGDKWTDAFDYAASQKMICLVGKDYDAAMAVRDAVHANARINAIITGGTPRVEHSGYWSDAETGQLCRCRPDLYRPDLGIIIDLKSTESAHPEAFARSVINYGYHAQEAFYTDGMNQVLPDARIEGFLFLAWEKKSPYAFGLYELPPSIVDEGRAIIRQSLATYAGCMKSDEWPSYGEGVTELSFRRYAYDLTEAPDGEMEAA